MPKKLSNEEFINKAIKIHGGKYNYDKTKYNGACNKVTIICPIHGEFLQTANDHINSSCGCSKCNGKERLDKNIFINESNQIHNNKFTYDKVEYKTTNTKVTITCPIHGDFKQTPHIHMDGFGCINCSGLKRKTIEEFIKQAIEIHGDKYNYDKVEYKNNNTKVIISCKEHGIFEQTPKTHLEGHGCSKCVGLKRKTTEEFIKQAIEIHGDKYNYDEINYINNHTKIKIKCKKHGLFEQEPNSHLKGDGGCKKCAIKKKSLNVKDFIIKSFTTHGDKYNYDRVNYVNSETKILIGCKEHGEFTQTPHGHLQGRGCLKCNYSIGENTIENFLKDRKIKYKTQYSFKDLRHKNTLKFDFGILDDNNNLKCLLEYNGLQHYEYINWFFKEEINFTEYKKRDCIKINYCKKNNIPLHIIKYNEDINLKLYNIINGI